MSSETPKKMPWYIPFLIIGIVVSTLVTLNFEIDRRPTSAAAYELMATWKDSPIRPNGIDYTTLIPMIDKAMEKGHVLNGEWRDIQEAQDVIDIEFYRLRLIAK
jgi:hypothetical protein